MNRIKHIGEQGLGIDTAFECNGYWIETQTTIYKGRRVTIREPNAMYFQANWCAGKKQEDLNKLLGLAKAVVEQDLRYPFYSKIKPYFNDPEFLEWMNGIAFEPYPEHDTKT